MSRLLKTIDMDLSVASINNAIKELRDFRKQLRECLSELARYLTEYGVEIARMNVIEMDAIFTGELLESGIHGVYYKRERCGVVYTDRPYAIYVEYGTGIVGANGPEYPGNMLPGYTYDINDHGYGGWWYPAEWGWWIPKTGKHAGEKMAWTAGRISKPFMYNTFRELERIAAKEGIEFFKIY